MTTQTKMIKAYIAAAGSAVLAFVSAGWAQTAEGPAPTWRTVVNNGTAIPGYPGRFFNSYNPPSVNARGLVVFRARSTGRQQGPVSGIFTRYVSGRRESAIEVIATRDSEVPQPNNTTYPVPGGQGAGIVCAIA